MSKLLEVHTVQASAFRILIEALKEILTDANFEFDEHQTLYLKYIFQSVYFLKF